MDQIEKGWLKVEDVKRRVAEVDAIKGDDEYAHRAEDKLYQDVLAAIAAGAPGAADLAREALKTLDIDFARWCA